MSSESFVFSPEYYKDDEHKKYLGILITGKDMTLKRNQRASRERSNITYSNKDTRRNNTHIVLRIILS